MLKIGMQDERVPRLRAALGKKAANFLTTSQMAAK